MTPSQIAIVETIFRLAESLKSQLSPDELATLDLLSADYKASKLADKGWFTIREASAWSGLGRRFLMEKINEGRLWHQRVSGRGGWGEIRIPRAHLDDQIVKGFPVLDLPTGAIEADLVHSRPVTRLIPRPKSDKKGVTKLILRPQVKK